MSVAALTLKISADLNSFSRDLRRMTRDVDKAAADITGLGKAMTLGITMPVGLALAALSKLGIEDERTANRMRRSFGGAVDEVNAKLERLMNVAPETAGALKDMAIDLNDTAVGLGFGARQAATLSTSMLTLAADVAAFRDISTEQALGGLTRGLQGSVKGLKDLGIALTTSDVQQEAYRLGLLKIGQELTPLGTALATYSLLVQRTGHMSGEAGRRVGDTARQLQFMKRDVLEVAGRLGNLLVPAVRVITAMVRDLVGIVEKVPAWFWIMAGSIAAAAAAMGPLLVVGSQLVAVFIKMRSAIILLAAADALPKLILLLRTMAKDPRILAMMLAIAGAVALATWAFKKFRQEAEDAVGATDGLANVDDLLGGFTSASALSPLQELQRQANALITGFEQGAQAGAPIVSIFDQIVALNERVLRLYDQQGDKLSEMALAAQQIALRTRAIMEMRNVASAMMGENGGEAVRSASRALLPVGQIRMDVAGAAIQDENGLRFREMLLSLKPIFDATRVAGIEFAEGIRRASQDFDLAMAKFMTSWSRKNIGDGLVAGLQTGLASLVEQLSPLAIAFKAITAVLEPLLPLIDALFAPLAALGEVIATLLLPIFRLLFVPLKFLAIVVAWLGEIIARVVAGLATAIGGIVKAIGQAIDALPFISAKGIIKAGQGMLDFAGSAYETADELRRQRKEIGRMQFGQTAEDVDELGDAARTTAEALLNVPTGFKIALERFRAQLPGERLPLPGSGGGGSVPTFPDGPIDTSDPLAELTHDQMQQVFDEALRIIGGIAKASLDPVRFRAIMEELARTMFTPVATLSPTIVNVVVLDGKVVSRSVVSNLQERAAQLFGNSSRWAEVQY